MSEANILLVDDEPGMLRYIRTLLEVDDYKVETATTGEEALKLVENGLEPELVLLDVLMPGIDGLETLGQLRQMRAGIKVVMLGRVGVPRKADGRAIAQQPDERGAVRGVAPRVFRIQIGA